MTSPPQPLVNDRLVTQIDGLSMDLVGRHARLKLRITGAEQLMSALSDLRLGLIQAAAQRELGSLADGECGLASAGESASSLYLDADAAAIDIHALVLRLTRLAAGLASGDQLRERWAQASTGFLDERERADAWYPGLWLMTLADPDSELAQCLLAAGIRSEQDYGERESSLPVDLRLALAQRRFEFGLLAAGWKSFGSPVQLDRLAAAVPPWVDDFELAEVGPSPAMQRAYLAQLNAKLPDRARILLWQSLAGVPLLGDDRVDLDRFKDFKSLLAWLLGQLDDPPLRLAQHILAARVGEPSIATVQTAEQLAAGLPEAQPTTSSGGRERVRRLQVDAVRFLHQGPRSADLMEQLDAAIRDWLQQAGQPLPLGPECPVRALRTAEPSAVERFLDLFFRDRRLPVYRRSDVGKGIVLAASALDQEMAVSELLRLLRKRFLPAERERRRLKPEFEAILQRYPNLDAKILQQAFFGLLNWSDDADRPRARVVSMGTTAAAVIVAALANKGRPMEIAEIADAAGCWLPGVQLPRTTLANTLAALTADPGNSRSTDIFEAVFQLGHGLYACHAAMPLAVEAQQALAERVVELVRNGRRSICHHERLGDAYQWHCSDLLAELETARAARDLEQVKLAHRWYVLDAILRYHRPEGLVNLQKGYWMEQVPGMHPEAHEKIDQNAVVEWVLEAYGLGRPMPIAEVRELVAKVQSLGATGQLQVASRLPSGGRIEKAGRGMLALKG